MQTISLWLTTFGLIFAVIDPIAYAPVFLMMTASDTPAQRRRMVARACVVAFAVLMLFTFAGNWILSFFGITIPALQISGGLIILALGFEMLNLFPVGRLTETEEKEGREKEDISIVPLAIPMISGPASIATVVVLAAKAGGPEEYAVIVVCIAVTLVLTYWALSSAERLMRLVGITGLNAATRIMGLLLCAMAVQFVINGVLAIRG